jgi:hypothetical protein
MRGLSVRASIALGGTSTAFSRQTWLLTLETHLRQPSSARIAQAEAPPRASTRSSQPVRPVVSAVR